MDIYTLLSHPLKPVTLYELQTKYNTEDVYELLEYLAVHDELMYMKELQQGK